MKWGKHKTAGKNRLYNRRNIMDTKHKVPSICYFFTTYTYQQKQKINTLFHLCVHSLTHSLTHSFIHTFIYTFVCSFIHLYICLFIHSFTHTLTHSLSYSIISCINFSEHIHLYI